MATVTGPDGSTFEETSLTALSYYQREPGFTVGGSLPAESVDLVDGSVEQVLADVGDDPQRAAAALAAETAPTGRNRVTLTEKLQGIVAASAEQS